MMNVNVNKDKSPKKDITPKNTQKNMLSIPLPKGKREQKVEENSNIYLNDLSMISTHSAI
jgi:hypothetical protein